MKKRITAAILSFCMLILAIPVTAGAVQDGDGKNNAWDISSAGDNSVQAYYEMIIESFDAVLHVAGEGKMKNYSSSNASPWGGSGFCNNVVQINIGNDVTNIGSYVFYSCTKVKEVSLPKSIASIKGSSFPKGCEIVANDSNYDIQWYNNEDFTGDSVNPTSASADDSALKATYYAKWVSKTGTSSGGDNTPTDPVIPPDNGASTKPSTPSGGDNTNTDDTPTNDQPSTGGNGGNNEEPKPDDTTPQKQQYDTSNLKFEDVTVPYDGKTHSLQATGVPDGVTVTYDGNGQFIAGTYTVTAKFTGDDQHEAIPNKEAKLTIEKADQDISFGYETLKVLTTDKTTKNPLIGVKEQAVVAYTSSDEKVATVDKEGLVTIAGEGTAKITAMTAETPDYKQTSVSYTLTVAETLDETDEEEDDSVLTTEYPNGVKVSVPKEQGKVKSAIVTVPEKVKSAVVTIPLENVTYGTVAMNAKTGEIMRLCAPTSDGLAVEVDATVSLILFDNSKIFTDIDGHWGEQYINFASAHNMFAGTSDTTFSADMSMTRGMMMTVIAKFNGVDVSGGSTWYERGMNWAKATGVSDGTNPMANITRE